MAASRSISAAPRPGTGAAMALLLSVALTVAIYAVPWGHHVAWPLLWLSTLVHELGHGLTAVVVGGRFESFVLWPDGSGMAAYRGAPGRLARAAVAAGGLLGPAVCAALLFVAGRRAGASRAALGVFGTGLLVADVWVVRNLFGWVYVSALAALLLLIAFRSRGPAAQLAVVFLAVQLALSVFSRSDYLFTDTARTAQGSGPSDVAVVAEALVVAPYWVWGAVIAVVSVLILVLGVLGFLHRGAPRSR